MGDFDDQETRLYRLCNLYSGKGRDGRNERENKEMHQLYEDRIGRARHACREGKCLQIYNLQYEEFTKIYDAKDAVEGVSDTFIDIDTQYRVVRTNKSFWREFLEEEETG